MEPWRVFWSVDSLYIGRGTLHQLKHVSAYPVFVCFDDSSWDTMGPMQIGYDENMDSLTALRAWLEKQL